jgi:hypothetical protein
MQPVSRQQNGKHVPAATYTNITTELLLETVFSGWSVQSGYKEDSLGDPFQLLLVSWKLACEEKTRRLV